MLPVYRDWLAAWPTPAALAAASPAAALRAWGRLGYPRRALWLHAAARACCTRHAGVVPATVAELKALPGVGDYTARAVAAFGFGAREPVVDVHIARVLRRSVGGRDDRRPPSAGDRRELAALLPTGAAAAARCCAAAMELGALICRPRAPRCGDCPLTASCAWRAAGKPPGRPRAARPDYAGSDRAARGAILAVLRAAPGGCPPERLAAAWPADAGQRARALESLVRDGLAVPGAAGYSLPGL